MSEKVTAVHLQPGQGVIYVTEDHSRIYSNFHVDTFRSNYNFTEEALSKILDIFKQNHHFVKKGCYYSASQTYVCSPHFPLLVYNDVFLKVMEIVNDERSYYLIADERFFDA